ncbi:hypothetical protein BD770DRAFT_440702 [Pilaira anomala]|nr:hypothetical protein BD770DRAFT_440702 [Pilaira anomala]
MAEFDIVQGVQAPTLVEESLFCLKSLTDLRKCIKNKDAQLESTTMNDTVIKKVATKKERALQYNVYTMEDRRRPVSQLNETHKTHLVRFFDEDASATVQNAVESFLTASFTGLQIKKSKVAEVMSEECNLSIKVVSRHPLGFNINMRRSRGWFKRGTEAVITTPSARGVSHTAIGANSAIGVVILSMRGSKRKAPQDRLSVPKGTIGGHYLQFLNDTMDIMDEFPKVKGYFIVMDNPPIHVPQIIDLVIISRGYTPKSLTTRIIEASEAVPVEHLRAFIQDSNNNMSVDNLSISFASSMGIENIQDEYLSKNNLYTDLDQLERSVEAEFEQYMNQARSFPFQEEQDQVTREHPELEDASVHSDYEILGADLLDQVNDDLDLDNDSWQRYLENNDVDDNYNVKPLRNNTNTSFRRDENEGEYAENPHYSNSTSPGQYFRARSLPLNSFDNVWQQNQDEEREKEEEREEEELEEEQEEEEEEEEEERKVDFSFTSSVKEEVKTATDKLLETRFKSLPTSLRLFPKYELPEIELHHPYTQKKKKSLNNGSISSTYQQCSSRRKTASTLSSFQNSISDRQEEQQEREDACIIEPSSLHFLCEMSAKTIYAKIIHLKITNPSSNNVRSFSIYSSKNLLEFEMDQGMILEHEVVQVKIKVQSNALLSHRRQQASLDEYPSIYDKVLVLIDHQHVTELEVNIDFMSLDDDDDNDDDQPKECDRPKCPYCALEKGYPLHSL